MVSTSPVDRARRRSALVVGLLLTTWLSMSCGGTGDSTEFEDEGTICLGGSSHGDRAGLEAGEPVEITVMFDGCISYCHEVDEAWCDIRREGDILMLRSRGSYTPLGGVCPNMCVRFTAECTGPPLEAGRYTLRHGEHSLFKSSPETYQFDVPGTEGEDSCLKRR